MSDPAAVPPARGGPQRIPRPAGTRPGPGPVWARPGSALPARVGTEAVRRAVVVRPELDHGAPADETLPVELPSRSPRPAAVLVAVFDGLDAGGTGERQAHVVLTRRSNRLRTHTGEVSFPGGRLEAGEDPVAAALRETEEEIGLPPAAVEIIGRLSPLSTYTSRAGITPFVGVLGSPPDLRANPAEVDRVLTVPLVELLSPGVHHEEMWPRPDGGWHPVQFFDLVGDTVWGATGRMLRELLDLVWATVAGPEPGAAR